MVDDDVAVIDALEKNELDYGKRRSLTGSSAKEDKVEDYSLDGKIIINLLQRVNEPYLFVLNPLAKSIAHSNTTSKALVKTKNLDNYHNEMKAQILMHIESHRYDFTRI